MAFDVGAVFVPVLPNLSGFGPAMTKAFAGVGVGLGVVGAVATKLALDFDKAFTKIGALSNASAKDIEAWKQQVLSLSGETAQAPEELADALFFLASAGLEASQIMPTLEIAAKASAVGLGETEEIASILASALNAYAESGLTAAQATDTLVAAVREGRAEPEEFAGALGRILPIAAATGVTFDQVTASLAALSNIGLDVNEGVTAMRGVLQAIAAPGTQAAEAMGKLGLSAQDLLDAISEDGIIGALRLLDTAAQDQTTTQAAYNGILRKIVPNVRALTGVLGLTGQEAEKVDKIFENVLGSTGSLDEAFKTTAESSAFQMEKALNDLTVVLTEVGLKLLPVVVDVVQVLTPLLGVLAENLDLVVVAFVGFKAAQFIPSLFGGIGVAALGMQGALLSAQVAAAGLGVSLLAIAPAVGVGTGGIQELDQATFDSLNQQLGFKQSIDVSTGAVREFGEEASGASKGIDRSSIAMREMAGSAMEAARGTQALDKVAKEISRSLQAEIPALRGTATTYKETFTLSPGELVKIAASWARIARTIASDLREIARADLTPSMREAISALPPEMRNAWVRGNASQRAAIQNSIKTTFKIEDQMPALAKQALTGGTQVGADMARGMKNGIEGGTQAIIAAARSAVTQAIAAARIAAQATSPSKKMFLLGLDLMTGLQEGITDNQQKVIDAAQKVIDKAISAMTKDLEKLQAELDKVLSKASSFRDSLRSGFDAFLDLSGGFNRQVDAVEHLALVIAEFGEASWQAAEAQKALLEDQKSLTDEPMMFTAGPTGQSITDFVASQVAGAQLLSDVLKALKSKGAGKELLAQVAQGGQGGLLFGQTLMQQGPGAITAVNQALGTINELAGGVAQGITQKFFGEKIDDLREDVQDLTRAMKVLEKPQRLLVEFRGGDANALRQYILSVLAQSQLANSPL